MISQLLPAVVALVLLLAVAGCRSTRLTADRLEKFRPGTRIEAMSAVAPEIRKYPSGALRAGVLLENCRGFSPLRDPVSLYRQWPRNVLLKVTPADLLLGIGVSQYDVDALNSELITFFTPDGRFIGYWAYSHLEADDPARLAGEVAAWRASGLKPKDFSSDAYFPRRR